ncbi:MAG TPA: amidohydrolase family protein [Candidatus Binatia bacterium]|nr:amidohydrolase family protein [Candidatus Binatia bacterium]
MSRLLPAVLACLLGLAPTAARAQALPIFDAHIHYSEPDWDVLTPERALSILARAHVFRALVSSTPDEGTLRLYQRAPRGIVPFLRPYRTRGDMATWTRDPAVAAYVEERLKRGIYRGIGEFHLGLDDVETPVVRRFAELAERDGLYFHAHTDETTMERLLTRYPRVRMIWAHAGMSAPPAAVERMLDRFATLWVELSLRSDVAPGGRLDPAWRALFLKHPDRFMVGTDTWVTSRWETLPQSMQAIQEWLAQLPRDVAERIAFTNADRLFPVGPAGP